VWTPLRPGLAAGRRLSAALAAACLIGFPGLARAGGEHLRLEVEVVEEGARTETRMVDLDLRGTAKPENDDWLAFLLALGLAGGTVPVWIWLNRRRPNAASATRSF